MLVRIVKNWDFPDLLRQTPGGSGVWGGVRFTLEAVEKCDWLIVLNQMNKNIEVECPPQNVWALFQEPYEPAFLPWMKFGHRQFARVYTHHPPSGHSRYRSSPPLVPWHIGRSFDQLARDLNSPKNERVSWVTSNLQVLPGHKLRFDFLDYMKKHKENGFDFFGKGISYIDDKWDAIAPYRYSIAVENFSGPDYWTEKVADCWLAGTLPFYYGCTNLEIYFPPDSFIRIDIRQPDVAYRTICESLEACEYERRVEAIQEARQLYLHRHQFFPRMCTEILGARSSGGLPQTVRLKKFHAGVLKQIMGRLPVNQR